MTHFKILDAGRVSDRPSLHTELQTVLELPGYYGRNLDALYDCLTDFEEPVTLLIVDSGLLSERLGDYAGNFLKTLSDAADFGPNFSFRLY